MGAVRFYHLTRDPVERALAQLLRRALDAGLRVEVRGTDPARLSWLDEKLWLIDDAEFLPHGLAGGAHDARQPVLLTTAETVAADTRCVMAIDGAEVVPDEVAALDRTFLLFDGGDGPSLVRARQQWKALKAAGAEAEYWSQEDGRWGRKA
ncbi:MAG: DNA polymerase III subunit chi [Qingshengfaniella sp.]